MQYMDTTNIEYLSGSTSIPNNISGSNSIPNIHTKASLWNYYTWVPQDVWPDWNSPPNTNTWQYTCSLRNTWTRKAATWMPLKLDASSPGRHICPCSPINEAPHMIRRATPRNNISLPCINTTNNCTFALQPYSIKSLGCWPALEVL